MKLKTTITVEGEHFVSMLSKELTGEVQTVLSVYTPMNDSELLSSVWEALGQEEPDFDGDFIGRSEDVNNHGYGLLLAVTNLNSDLSYLIDIREDNTVIQLNTGCALNGNAVHGIQTEASEVKDLLPLLDLYSGTEEFPKEVFDLLYK